MKKLLIVAGILTVSMAFVQCEGGPYDSSGNGAVIREIEENDMDQLEGKHGDTVIIPNSGSDRSSEDNMGRGTHADPTDSTHQTGSGHDRH